MGQQATKEEERITQSVNRIRKDLRAGKIKAIEVEPIQNTLQGYLEIIQRHDIYGTGKSTSLEHSIEVTSKELDGLKQEVGLDGAPIRHSLSRSSSKNQSKQRRRSVKTIVGLANAVRQDLRSGKIQPADYDRVQGDLVNYSQELSSKGKKQEVDIAQKLISSVTQELLNKQQQNTDSVRRSSTSSSLRRSSLKSERRPKETHKIVSTHSMRTLDDFESKFKTLQQDIEVSKTSRDKAKLRFLAKSVQTLMVDLQMEDNQTVDEEKKTLLEKNLQVAYQDIEDIKKQINQESNIKYLNELQAKENKVKILEGLEEIENALTALGAQLDNLNFQEEKVTYLKYKTQLDLIQPEDEEIAAKKSEVVECLLNLEKVFTRVEMEERLNQAEYRHFQYKIDLKHFSYTMEEEGYKKHKQYLTQLRDYVSKISEVNSKIDDKKKYVLFNIDNNIVALEKKAKENEEKLLRNKEVSNSKTLRNSVVDLTETVRETANSGELNEILPFLNEIKAIIEARLAPQEETNVERTEVDYPVWKEDTHSTTENVLIDLMSVGSRVNYLISKIQSGNSTQDYKSIRNKLFENKNYLQGLKLPASRSSLLKSKEEILRQIDGALSSLDYLEKNEERVSEKQSQFNQEVRKLKEKVIRYSGAYQNVLYNSIEKDLNRCINKADTIFEDAGQSTKVKEDLENTKRILEEKSTKNQEHSLNDSNKLTDIRENLGTVQRELSKDEPLDQKDLDALDARLTLSVLSLHSIKESSAEKDKLYKDIDSQFQKIQQMILVNKPTTTHSESRPKHHEHSVAQTLATLEKDLEEIRPQVLTFVGNETDPHFLLLNEILASGTVKLDEMILDPSSELFALKSKLMDDIHKFSDVLDVRVNQTEEIEKLERDVQVILIRIDSFNGFLGDPDFSRLDEDIIRLKVNLAKLHVDQELLPRKNACVKEVDGCMRRLNETAKPISQTIGTLV